MKTNKILKLQFKGKQYKHLEDGLTECVLKVDLFLDQYKEEFGYPSNRVRKAIKRLGIDFDDKGYILIRGYARCLEPDTYDKKIGERISEAKAKRNAYRLGFRIGTIMELELRRELDEVMEFNNQMVRCEAKENEHKEYIENNL